MQKVQHEENMKSETIAKHERSAIWKSATQKECNEKEVEHENSATRKQCNKKKLKRDKKATREKSNMDIVQLEQSDRVKFQKQYKKDCTNR